MISNKQPIKRLVVRNFKGQKLPEDYESTSWASLRLGLTAILQGSQPETCLEILYKTCENLVRSNMGNNLYSKVYELIELSNKSLADNLLMELKSKTGMNLLESIAEIWSMYCTRLKLVENVLMYMDRCYVLQKPELKSIQYFHLHYLFEASGLFDGVKKSLLQSIIAARQSRTVANLELQRTLVEMLVDVGLFGQFEGSLINESSKQIEKNILDDNYKSFEYVEMIAFALLHEEKFVSALNLPKESQLKLIKIAEKSVLSDNIATVLASGLALLIEATWKPAELDIVEPPMNDFSELQKGSDPMFDLRLLIKLAYRVNAVDLVKSNWSSFIKSYGSTIIATGKEESLIEDILQFKSRLEGIVVDVFNKDPIIENSLKESFESFVNSRQTRLADLIAQYLDRLLREGKPTSATERLPDENLIELIDKVIVIFRYLQCKDAVEVAYKKLLSKRLLQNRMLSVDLEKEVVKRFKSECGAQFTSRLEGMFKDFEASPELNASFKDSKNYKESTIDFSVTVASSGIWPHPDDIVVNVPKEVLAHQEAFAEFYGTKHNGRNLAWNQNMGFCVVKANFPQGVKELQVSVPQAIVLSAFNQHDKLTVSEIMKVCHLDLDQVKKTLESLSSGRHQILINESQTEKITKSDMFSYNSGFNSRLVRIRLNSYHQAKVNSEEKASIPIQLLDDKQHQIDAAIVRVIKTERRMKRADLIAAALEAIKLDIPKKEVDKRIEILTTREFLTLDKDDSDYLVYVP